jgi:hypothetical protein
LAFWNSVSRYFSGPSCSSWSLWKSRGKPAVWPLLVYWHFELKSGPIYGAHSFHGLGLVSGWAKAAESRAPAVSHLAPGKILDLNKRSL